MIFENEINGYKKIGLNDLEILEKYYQAYCKSMITIDVLEKVCNENGYLLKEDFLKLPFNEQCEVVFSNYCYKEKETLPQEEVNEEEVEEKENNDEGTFINFEIEPYFSYADYHTDCLLKVKDVLTKTQYSFFKSITLFNHCDKFYEKFKLKFVFSSDMFYINDLSLSEIRPNEEIKVKIPFIHVNKASYDKLNEEVIENLTIELWYNETLINSCEKLFTILPINQPSLYVKEDKRLYAKYVIPNTPRVKQLTLDAVKYNGGSFVGYQNSQIKSIYNEIQAIYLAIHEQGIVYQNPPVGEIASDNLISQKLRLPEEVLRDKKGTCIDLSILFCSCLEEIGLHPILIIIPGHAFVGCFLKSDDKFLNCIEKDSLQVYNNVGLIDKICLIETTLVTADSKATFKEAQEAAEGRIKSFYSNCFDAIDINNCHSGIFKFIPYEYLDTDLEEAIRPLEIKADSFNNVEEIKYVDVSRKQNKNRFTFWKKKLLDLTEANMLVDFNLRINNSLKVFIDSDFPEFIKKHDSFKVNIVEVTGNNQKERLDNYNSSKKLNDVLVGGYNKNDVYLYGLEKVFRNLIKDNQSAIDESGAPTLYLCLGAISYVKKNNAAGLAPFMVLPIKINKNTNTYTCSYDYDDLRINQTFFEYYKQEHSYDFSDLYDFEKNNTNYHDVAATFKSRGFKNLMLIEDLIFICNLSFAHYIMWKDMNDREEELSKHPVIESIISNENHLKNLAETDCGIDQFELYDQFAAPMSYDSTQLRAILECGKGNSFILDGPPGTGKSQTIVNMIVNAFYHGKKVLFVAEKKAALDVVADRLEKLGDSSTSYNLGRFCLELHSNKANKGSFFTKIKDAMEQNAIKDPKNFENVCSELETRKKAISDQIKLMHEKRYYYSLYEAIVKVNELKDYLDLIKLDEDYVKDLTSSQVDYVLDSIRKIQEIAGTIPYFDNSPLKYLKISDINYSDKDIILNDFRNYRDVYNEFVENYKELSKNIAFKFRYDNETVIKVLNVLDIILKCKIYDKKIFELSEYNEHEFIFNLFDKTKELNSVEEVLRRSIKFEEVFTFDDFGTYNAYINDTNFITKFFNKIKFEKRVKQLLLPGIKSKELLDLYSKVLKYRNLYKEIEKNSNFISNIIENKYIDVKDNIKEIENTYKNSLKFIEAINELKSYGFLNMYKLFINVYYQHNSNVDLEYSITRKSLNDFSEFEKQLVDKYQIDYLIFKKMSNCGEKYSEFLDYLSDDEHFSYLVDMARINQITKDLEVKGLKKLIDALRMNKLEFDYMDEAYTVSIADSMIKLYFKDRDINYFNASTFGSMIKKYQDLILEYDNLVIASVSSKLTKNLLPMDVNYAPSSPIGVLKKLASTGGRGVTIRETLTKYGDLIMSYFPCFLMSPLSAAQYLAVDNKNSSMFDLIIFDEASQIPVHEAVGPIARGKNLIVAGDPEQMPPTRYFMSNIEFTGEDKEYEDADSLLDECIAIGLPRIRLSYHYRSRHESLINFSNHYFYNDDLYTFPSPVTSNSRIDFKYVDLENAKYSSKISDEELDAIIEEFKNIYNDESTCDKSVGIIVFNMNQQDKVYDAITDLLFKDHELAEKVQHATELTNESWFVKSLENVQGDERDIIILSVGFRKSSSNKAVVVGPLVRTNGERRLNVAVTRSKEKMIVVSTIRYTDFESDNYINSRGALLLKHFLMLAEEQTFERQQTISTLDNSIVHFIKNDIESRGYKVDINIGNSDFKVDLAIRNSTGEGYDLGILVDTKGLDSDITCRDKMFVQPSILNGLKWKIISIYSLEYYKNPTATIDKIIDAVDDPYIAQDYKLNVQIEKEEEQSFAYNTLPYEKARKLYNISYSTEYGFEGNIMYNLDKIIDIEGPIAFEVIKDRIKNLCEMQVFSQKAKIKLQQCLSKFDSQSTTDQTQTFYWPKGSKYELNYFRPNNDFIYRDIYDISKEEIGNAMKQILEVQISLNDVDLFKEVLRLFGMEGVVLNSRIKDRMNYVYNWMKRNSRL